MAPQTTRSRVEFRDLSTPLVVLLISLILTAASSFYARKYFVSELSARFNKNSALITEAVRLKLESYVNLILSAKGYLDARPDLGTTDFHAYAQRIGIQERYPGLKSLTYAKKNSKRASDFVITLIEPETQDNLNAIGFNPFTLPERIPYLERARDTGLPVTGSRTHLAFDPKKVGQPAFQIYVPLYRRGAPTQTVENRREALTGYLWGSFRSDDFFDAIIQRGLDRELKMDFEVFSALVPDAANFLHDHNRSGVEALAAVRTSAFYSIERLPLAGNTWSIAFHSLPGFVPRSAWGVPLTIALLGSTVSFLLALLVWQVQQRVGNEQRAKDLIRFLYEVSNAIFTAPLDVDMKVQSLTKALIPGLGDYSAVVLLGPQPGSYRVASFDVQGRLDAAEKILRENPLDLDAPTGLGYVLRTGNYEFYGHVTPENIHSVAFRPGIRSFLEKVGVSCAMTVPILRGDKIQGALSILGRGNRTYNEDDLQVAMELARKLSDALENVKLYEQTQESVRLRDEFISIASHELKTPLTTLKLQAQMCMRMSGDAKETALTTGRMGEMSVSVDQQVNRLSRLIDDMLSVSKIRSGLLKLEVEEFDLSKLLQEVCLGFHEELSRGGCSLTLSASEPVPVCWDRFRIEQVVLNLLSNARKYGAGKPIEVSVERSEAGVVIRVRDHGIGIDPVDHERIFNRFERAVSSSKISGMGLGLFIAQQIVAAHQGRIRVESALGQGATFIVEIPAKPPV